MNPVFCLAIELKQRKPVDLATWYYDIWNLLRENWYLENADKRI